MGVKLGQKWAVKDGNLLASNQVGSRFFNKEFDFSRASNGTYVDRDGLLKTAELYNLLRYSQDFQAIQYAYSQVSIIPDNAISPNGILNATKIVPNSGSVNRYIYYNSFIGTIGQTYTTSFYIKDSNVGEAKFWSRVTGSYKNAIIDLSTGEISSSSFVTAPSVENVGNGWWRVSYIETASGSADVPFYIQVGNNWVGNGVDGVYIFGAQIVEGTQRDYQYTNGLQGLPRISFEDGVGHLLLEPQRSNLITHSNSYNSWTKDDVTLTSGQSGVYGTNNAWLIQGNTNSSRHNINKSVSSTGQHSFSLYAKAKELQYIQIASAQTTDEYANFDLSDGSVGNVGSRFLDAKATSVGNGWYRLSVYTNNGFNSFYISLIQSKTDGWLPTYSGTNSTDGLYIQHAQLESGSYPTSIIETTTTSVTRLADVCNNSGSAQDFNSEEGVLYVELKLDTNALQNQYSMISIGDALNNRVQLTFIQNSNDFSAIVGSSIGTRELLFPFNYGSYNKIALKYDSSGFKVFHNGVFVGNNTYAISGLDLQTLQFRFPTGTQYDFYGKVRNLQVFTEALSDAELQQLTT